MDNQVTVESSRDILITEYMRVRHYTESLCSLLETDDFQIQSIEQTSPPKWHIAHVSWLFEAFVLSRFIEGYKPVNANYDYLFNSYYYTHGQMYPRPKRGMLSRPSVEEIFNYRAEVDSRICLLLENIEEVHWQELAFFIILGLNHEEQHQELLLMDIKHNFFVNPLKPAYREDLPTPAGEARDIRWMECTGGLHHIGHSGNGFCYDNETPRHKVLIRDHYLADRLITNAEFQAFIQDGSYDNPSLWLSDGWALIKKEGWQHPLYWQANDNGWTQFTLAGVRDLNPHEPVCHLSFYEADAYARWAGKRLPLEGELELELAKHPVQGNFGDKELFHPAPAEKSGQWYGDLWAWTSSPYSAYPDFKPLAGSVGEYNGKFMSNQMVLKGGSCITPQGHTRPTYRNFFYPNERWAFTGLRLAEDA